MSIQSVNPSTGTVIKSFPEHSEAVVNEILWQADQAFVEWRHTGVRERAARMKAAAGLLRRNQDAYARLIAEEMGKPLAQGRAEVEKGAVTCDYYAEQAERFLSPELIETDARNPKSQGRLLSPDGADEREKRHVGL